MPRIDQEANELLSMSVTDALDGWYGGNRTDLAKTIGVSRRTIGRVIEGQTAHKPETIHRIVRVTERSPEIQEAFIQVLLGSDEVNIFRANSQPPEVTTPVEGRELI